MTDELITWLRGVLDEDERLARAANQAYPYAPHAEPPTEGVHWRWVVGPNWETVDMDAAEEFVAEPGHDCWLATVEEWPNDHGRMMPRAYTNSAIEVDVHAARHIVRHDPASVLADVAAKRAILVTLGAAEERSMPVEAWVIAKQVLVELAAAYASRSGYRPEWAPTSSTEQEQTRE